MTLIRRILGRCSHNVSPYHPCGQCLRAIAETAGAR